MGHGASNRIHNKAKLPANFIALNNLRWRCLKPRLFSRRWRIAENRRLIAPERSLTWLGEAVIAPRKLLTWS
jgi:hypothetical protein